MNNHLQYYKFFLSVVIYSLTFTWSISCRRDETLKNRDFKTLREKMVFEQIENRSISDTAVIQAMKKVERHRFVLNEFQKFAYDDTPLPIGSGQTISQPYIVAYMTEAIHPQKNHKVLEIGTGSGYQAAVLAEIVDSVFTIEIIPELGNRAKQILDSLGYDNVLVKIGDGYNGWTEHAPFDAIVVTAAFDSIPPPLTNQLKEGGKLIMPVGSSHEVQVLKLIEKKDNSLTTKELLPVRFVPLQRDSFKEAHENYK